jgi:FemAB-related protein (PEP-CTERM system-associated)
MTSHAADVESTAIASVAPIRVRMFGAADERDWDAFVKRCAAATFFHLIGWRDVIQNVLHHRCHNLLAERGNSIVGVLPLAEVKSRLFGHALTSLPFCVYGGPAADEPAVENALIDAAVELARSLDVEYLELRNRSPRCPGWPRQELYATFRKAIERDAERNLLAVPRKQRAMIRKGIGHRLRSVIDPTPERFFELYADNMHRHGTPPHSKRYFEHLHATFEDACETLVVVDSNGSPVSGVMSFYFRDEVLPYYAGDTVAARDLAANDFKYWELMRCAGERGVRLFDFGRSKQGTGSFAFKKNWGFEPQLLGYEFQLFDRAAIPQNNPLNPRYKAFISVWRRLPRRVATAIGPFVVRNLG